MKGMLFIFMSGCLIFAQQVFPVSAFHVDDTLWFEAAGSDSLGLTHIWIGGPERNDNVKMRKLQVAENEGLTVTLYPISCPSRNSNKRLLES